MTLFGKSRLNKNSVEAFFRCNAFSTHWNERFSICEERFIFNINRLLTEREGRTGEYWPEVVAVRTERSEVRTARTEGQYSPVRPEQARLVSGLLYGTLFLIVKCNGILFLIVKCNFKKVL